MIVKPSGSGHHAPHVLRIILRVVARHGKAQRAVIDADLVAHLAAQQLVDRQARGLAGDVPERHLDGAHGAAVGLERAALADAQHHPLDVGRVRADQGLAEGEHLRLDERLVVLDLRDSR